MKGPVWAGVSKEAKDLINRLLVVEPSLRITGKDILAHPWMQMELLDKPTVEVEEVEQIEESKKAKKVRPKKAIPKKMK